MRAMFMADWMNAIFIHFEVPAEILQKEVPFPLDLRDGKAYVSLVAFTQRDLRPAIGGDIARRLSAPLATHEFLNIRTYVRVNSEPGIYFLAEYIPNRLAALIGPRLYGLPYRLGNLSYIIDIHRYFYNGTIQCGDTLAFHATLVEPLRTPASPGSLDSFLIERYSAFTHTRTTARRFRIDHEPWIHASAEVAVTDPSLLRVTGGWFEHARYAGAHFSPGLRNVRIGAPERLSPVGAAVRWTPPAVMVLAAMASIAVLPPWGFMWAICFALYFGCKWLTLVEPLHELHPTLARRIGYLLAWPGMDAKAFFDPSRHAAAPRGREWLEAVLKIGLGLILLAGIAPMIMPRHPLGGGWTGMIGLILLLHFGLFHLLSILWRRTDVDAPPIMSAPVLARSIGDFWNARWNMGFHVLASKYLFNPIRRRFGATAGLIGTFIVSGFLHDLVITLPARGGYGLPTAYFAIQGMGILAERLPSVRKLARQHPWAGRMMTLVIVAGPVGLLFPAVFVHRVIVPFLNAIGIY